MNIVQDAIASGGCLKSSESATFGVSFWVIPGGSRYDMARVEQAWFPTQEEADNFIARHTNPPAMAARA